MRRHPSRCAPNRGFLAAATVKYPIFLTARSQEAKSSFQVGRKCLHRLAIEIQMRVWVVLVDERHCRRAPYGQGLERRVRESVVGDNEAMEELQQVIIEYLENN